FKSRLSASHLNSNNQVNGAVTVSKFYAVRMPKNGRGAISRTKTEPGTCLKSTFGANMQKQILLIDDSDQIHTLVTSLLADEPVKINSAFDGQYGLTLAASLHPDLILLDVEMPDENGYEV